jgi:hypothetical protein
MSEMIERVARALAERKYGHCGGPDGSLTNDHRKNWMFCKDDARAAIEAMRESTPGMVKAICSAKVDLSVDGYCSSGRVGYEDSAREIHRAMIDAALEKDPS